MKTLRKILKWLDLDIRKKPVIKERPKIDFHKAFEDYYKTDSCFQKEKD